MKGRNLLDDFTKRWEKELKVCPKYINGNFMRLYYWITEKKGFNKNPKYQRLEFWKDFDDIAKRNKDCISFKIQKFA